MKDLKIIPLIILGFFFITSASAQGVLGKVVREGGEAWAKRSAVHQSHMASVANHARMVDKAPINHFRTSPTFNTVVHSPTRAIPVARNVNIVSRSGLTPTTRSASQISIPNKLGGSNNVASQSKSTVEKLSKVQKTRKTEFIGGKFSKTTDIRPGSGPGQSRAEYIRYKNSNGDVLRTRKDSYDRANNFQHKKPMTGGPEGRKQ